jgi:hypothetical protein
VSATFIPPTPGRIVLFHASEHDGIARLNGQPLAAMVAGVHNDRLVNLAVLDAYGNWQQRSNVILAQPNDERPNTAHATWMEYQVGQAAKTEQLQEQLQGGTGIFAETNGTSASETGLVSTNNDGAEETPDTDAPASNITTEAQL